MPIAWPKKIDWNCPSGILLTRLGHLVPPDRRTPIILFGSAALQLTIAPNIFYADSPR
jgi:hypothetical protein